MSATTALPSVGVEAQVEYLLRLGDTSLVLAQRLGEGVGHAPAVEEDLGFANIALDLLGQARLLLSHAGTVEGRGRDDDALAFFRSESEYRNLSLAETPNGDFGRTIVRQFLIDAWQLELYEALAGSADSQLAAIAAKAVGHHPPQGRQGDALPLAVQLELAGSARRWHRGKP
jgi:ring-1,2-phenylacetyl-CoA epoxidase subunit PaaC